MTRAYKEKNFDKRDANRVMLELRAGISLIETRLLPQLAKCLASDYKIPNKVMLKAMRRYTRLNRTN